MEKTVDSLEEVGDLSTNKIIYQVLSVNHFENLKFIWLMFISLQAFMMSLSTVLE